MRSRHIRIAMILTMITMLTTWACSTFDTPSSPDTSASSQAVTSSPVKPTTTPVSAESVCPSNVHTWTDQGVTICERRSDFNRETVCTTPEELREKGYVLQYEVGLANNSSDNIYSRVAIFHEAQAGCGAVGSNPGGITGLVSGATSVAVGNTGVTTYTFTADENACGRYQLDDAWGPLGVSVIGKVIDTGRDCPSCDIYDLQLFVEGQGLTRTVSVSFRNGKSNKKVSVNFGDGTSAELKNGESVRHTWDYGTYEVTATFEQSGLNCEQRAEVSNQIQTSCADLNVSLSACRDYSATSVAPSTFHACLQGNWNEPPTSGTLQWGDGSSESVGAPFSKSHEFTMKNTAQTFTATLNVVRGQLSCPAQLTIKVPPRDSTCEDFEAPVITGDIAMSLTATQASITSGTVAPAGGTFTPTLPATVDRLPYGSGSTMFNATYRLGYGPEELECFVQKDFSKEVPQKERSCGDVNPSVSVAVDGTSAKCTGTWTNPGSGSMKRDSESYGAISNGGFRTFSDLSSGSHSCTLKVDDGELSCTDTESFTIQRTCEIDHGSQAVSGCYKPNPWGNGNNPEDICGHYGLEYIGKNDSLSGSSHTLTMAARLAVIHWGGADCSGGAQYFQFVQNALNGQVVSTPGSGGASFAVYCGCPEDDD